MGKRKNSTNLQFGNLNLARSEDQLKLSKLMVELKLQATALTIKDMHNWRQGWQMALNGENPKRTALYDIYTDVESDLHLTGCIGQRKGFVTKRSFKLVDRSGKEDEKALDYFESVWFKDLMGYMLDCRYPGHSLVQLGDVYSVNGILRYNNVELIPRKHVIPEYGVIVREPGDEWQQGYDYRNADLSN